MTTPTCAWSTPLGSNATGVLLEVFPELATTVVILNAAGGGAGRPPSTIPVVEGEGGVVPAWTRILVYAGPLAAFCQKNEPEPVAPGLPVVEPTVIVDPLLFSLLTGM